MGIAVSDELQVIAKPLKALDNDNFLLERVVSIIKEYNVGKVVVGLPVRMGGGTSDLVRDIEVFVENLRREVNVDIVFWDESYTSKDAESLFMERFKRPPVKKKDKYVIDSYSAALLLQEYLDSKKGEK